MLKKAARPSHRRQDLGRSLDERIGSEIRALRRKRGLTINELAEISGLTGQQVQRSEVGVARISVFVLVRLAAALSVPVTHFIASANEQRAAE
jgi:transcriptional regulator with XRE-family HTH domain